jgi:hypothetical protein
LHHRGTPRCLYFSLGTCDVPKPQRQRAAPSGLRKHAHPPNARPSASPGAALSHCLRNFPLLYRRMRNLLCLFCALLALATTAADSTNRLAFPGIGFSIKALEEPAASGYYQPLTMALPSSEGFAPNVVVLTEKSSGSLDEYIAKSKRSFEQAKLEIILEKKVGSSVKFECAGELNGRKLHFYSRAEMSGDRLFVASATATAQQWKSEATRLKECVDSFRTEPKRGTSP